VPVIELGPTCLTVPGCTRPRLRYHGYCAEHAPPTPPLPPTRCNHPLRCYCGAETCVPELPPAVCELPNPAQILRDVHAHGKARQLRLVQP
jgi:hypothetical protein